MLDCSIQDKCGGCFYIKCDYSEQMKEKQVFAEKILTPYKLNKIIGMEGNPFNYRNKGKFAFKDGKMGFYEEGTHKIVYEKCKIQNEKINEIADFVFELVKKYKIAIYNEDRKKGFLRHLIIRYGVNTNEAMVIFVTTDSKMYKKDEIVKEIINRFSCVKSIVQNINDRVTNAILGNKTYKLYGTEFIFDKLGELKFKISPLSFYQINSKQTEVLYKTAIDLARINKDDTVFDLYSGIGTISLFVAKKAKKVYGIEIVKDAVKDAIENAKINKINNVRFISGKVEDNISKLCKQEKADVVFVDPPRIGLDNKTIETLLTVKPKKIVYISCGIESLKDNLEKLKRLYNIKCIQPVDMFPFTSHVENICVLELRNK